MSKLSLREWVDKYFSILKDKDENEEKVMKDNEKVNELKDTPPFVSLLLDGSMNRQEDIMKDNKKVKNNHSEDEYIIELNAHIEDYISLLKRNITKYARLSNQSVEPDILDYLHAHLKSDIKSLQLSSSQHNKLKDIIINKMKTL